MESTLLIKKTTTITGHIRFITNKEKKFLVFTYIFGLAIAIDKR